MKVVHFLRRARTGMFSIERLFEDVRGSIPATCEVTVWTCKHYSQGILGRILDVFSASFNQGEINHVTGDVNFLAILMSKRRTIITIHDFVVLDRLSGWRRWLFLLLWYRIPIARCRAVTVISEATLSNFAERFPQYMDKVRVIHNPVSPEFLYTPKEFNQRWPRVLQIGTKPNKNIERVAEALAEVPCRLVIVGDVTPAQMQVLARYGVDYEVKSGLSRPELVEEYVRCDLLLLASTYEGFGMPIVEAQSVGRPVVTSSIMSMPEVAGGGACLVDPFDSGSIRAGIMKIIEDAAYRDSIVAIGLQNCRKFCVQGVAFQYYKLYLEILGANSACHANGRDGVAS